MLLVLLVVVLLVALFMSVLKQNQNMVAYDKYKNIGSMKGVLKSDIIFLCLPTLFNEDTQEYDTTALEETCDILSKVNYQNAVIIKSTVTPGTCQHYAETYKLNIIHNPEFLTASTALKDFENQKHIVLGPTLNVPLVW